jgi:hypothetical protein
MRKRTIVSALNKSIRHWEKNLNILMDGMKENFLPATELKNNGFNIWAEECALCELNEDVCEECVICKVGFMECCNNNTWLAVRDIYIEYLKYSAHVDYKKLIYAVKMEIKFLNKVKTKYLSKGV